MDLLLEKCREKKNPFKIYLSKCFTIGSDNVDYFKNFSKVSKSHASLTYHYGSWYIKDVSRETGVYVNTARIGRDPVKLSYWDVIGLGGPIMGDGVFFCVLCPKEVAAQVTAIADRTSVSTIIRTQEDNDSDIHLTDDKGMKTHVIDLEDTLPVFSYMSHFFKGREESSHFLENHSTCTQKKSDSGIHLKDEKGMKKHLIKLESQPSSPNALNFFMLKNNAFCESENDSEGSTVDYMHLSESNFLDTPDDGDDCGIRRTSSVESLDIIMYPSPHILAKIDARKKPEQSRMPIKRYPSTKKYKMKSKAQHDSKLKEGCLLNGSKKIMVKRGRKKSNLNKQNRNP